MCLSVINHNQLHRKLDTPSRLSHDALCQSPRVGNLDAQRSSRLGWRRAVSPRQRHPQGPTGDLGWAGTGAGCAVYGGPGGHTEESSDSHLLSALVSGREGEEAGVDGVHAKAAHHLERHGQKPDAVAGNRRSARLIFKTVADPEFSLFSINT